MSCTDDKLILNKLLIMLSILKEIKPEYSLEGLMLKLKLQYFGPPGAKSHWKRLWGWKSSRAGGEAGDRGWNGWMASLTRWTRLSKLWETWRTEEPVLPAAVYGVTKSQTWLSDWKTTATNNRGIILPYFTILLSTWELLLKIKLIDKQGRRRGWDVWRE